MPIGFSRIRIAGFKSFAEPAIVEIHPGLTGIVGPNGCGKSNVVEALRWAMGESSAKSLRGGEMDDVIFAGTTNRPARNLAEVTLTLEASATSAFPPPFDGQSELEVGRRIERGSGSFYRVNGKEARARDVQTLFADLASGARSSAMVSQGRVGSLVNARPDERRAILEEAAGIGGLHSRRHEAELKLRAAEANAERAEDLRTQLSAQLGGLQKQARQANRYRNLSGLIRAAECAYLAVQRDRSVAARTAAHARLEELRCAIASAVTQAGAQATAATIAAEALPPLRVAESEARTALERRRIARERIEAEETAARAAITAAQEALARIGRDRQHAAQLQRDADEAEQRLGGEAARHAEEASLHPALAEAAAAELAAAEAALQAADAAMHRATVAQAALAARGQALADGLSQATGRMHKIESAWHGLNREHEAIQPIESARLAEAVESLETQRERASRAAAAQEQAEAARNAAQTAHQAARAQVNQTEPVRARLAAEQQALSEILAVHGANAAARLIDAVTVPEGLEAAIGAVLGEELNLPDDAAAPRHLCTLPPFDSPAALPAASTALATLVQAPPALGRALSQIGLIDAADGDALQPSLQAGQTLISREGAVWRWDGYRQRAGVPTAAAVRLRQHNRLAELRGQRMAADAAHSEAQSAAQAAMAAERAAIAAEADSRTARRTAEQALERARQDANDLQRRAETAATRIAALESQLVRIGAERAAAEAEHQAAQRDHQALPDLAEAQQQMQAARAALATARASETTARGRADALQRQASSRHGRLRTIIAERAGWAERARDAAARTAELDARRAQAQAAADDLSGQPDQLAQARTEAIESLSQAELVHRAAASALQAAEQHAATATRDDRAAEAALAGMRETILRAESDCRAADHAWGSVAERILEKLGHEPDLPGAADLSAEAEDQARRKAERLVREREEMGPVNLRAEIEAGEIETRLASIDRDREELTAAINKLRGSIGHLNREGRERLSQVFAEVDKHFQQLFARMFGGGRAQLALVGSDDPLQAGLEIYAQPPGKKLATLSLLSGGEQALTALSLIFAVFRCNPAPVCVLDEVDAPLDDANIDRFCALLADMVAETGTRFMVVTHHHMTMARMDRLYGVTMAERGVSRLLSVDLQRAAELVEPMAMAAE